MATKKSMKERMEQFSKEAVGTKKEAAPEGTTLLAFRVPKSWPKSLHIWALQNNTTVQALCNEILGREIKKRGIL